MSNKCGDSWPWGNTIILLLVIVTILIITVGIVVVIIGNTWSLTSIKIVPESVVILVKIWNSLINLFSISNAGFLLDLAVRKVISVLPNNQFWASSYPPTQLHPNRPTLWKIFIAASRDLIEATCLLRKYFPQPSFKSTLSTVPYFTLKRPHMDRAAIILTLLDPEGGGRSAPSRANVITHKNQWVEILIIFCIFLSSCICIFLMHVGYVKNHFSW